MKAILIDVINQRIKYVDVKGEEISNFIGNGCELTDSPFAYPNGDMLYCDKDGYENKQIGGFYYPSWLLPITGNAIIVGKSGDCKSSLADIEINLRFVPRAAMEIFKKSITV